MRLLLFPFTTLVLFLSITITTTTRADAAIVVRGNPTFTRTDSQGRPAGDNLLSLEPTGISQRDCVEDQRARFFLDLSEFVPEGTLEAWVSRDDGTDCTDPTVRATSACVRLTADPISPKKEVDVALSIRSIVSVLAKKDAAAAASPTTTIAACRMAAEPGRASAAIQFLYFDVAGTASLAPSSQAARVVLSVDMVIPSRPSAAPTITKGGPFGSLNIAWPHGVESGTRTNIYCTKVTVQNSIGGDTSKCAPTGFKVTDAEGDSDKEIATVVPTAGFDASFLCATTTGPEDQTTMLTSDQRPFELGGVYAFAVAHVDAFGNVGELSTPACYEPEKVVQEQCSFSTTTKTATTITPAALLLLGVIAAARRRRRRKRSLAHISASR